MLDTRGDQLLSRTYKESLWAGVSISPETQKENPTRSQIEAVIDHKLDGVRAKLLALWDEWHGEERGEG